jgi:hypothetical protein
MNLSDSDIAVMVLAVVFGTVGPALLVNGILTLLIACLLFVVVILIFYLYKNRIGIKVTGIICIVFAALYAVTSVIAIVYNIPVSWPT